MFFKATLRRWMCPYHYHLTPAEYLSWTRHNWNIFSENYYEQISRMSSFPTHSFRLDAIFVFIFLFVLRSNCPCALCVCGGVIRSLGVHVWVRLILFFLPEMKYFVRIWTQQISRVNYDERKNTGDFELDKILIFIFTSANEDSCDRHCGIVSEQKAYSISIPIRFQFWVRQWRHSDFQQNENRKNERNANGFFRITTVVDLIISIQQNEAIINRLSYQLVH